MSDERGHELDAATLEQYRAAVERAAAEIRTPEVRAALTGGVGKLLAALARRDGRERAMMDLIRAVADGWPEDSAAGHVRDIFIASIRHEARTLLKGDA